MKNGQLPLSGIRVLDLTQVAAGPFCSMLLADFGAEVIKIEIPKQGDALRKWGPPFIGGESVYFLGLNRNKKSMTLNLKSEKGREIFLELVKRSDVIIENFRPGTMEKLGLTYELLKSINPKIVYARISGYGQIGPYSKRGGYDLLIQGESGLISVTGEADRPPGAKVGVAIVDFGAGMYAAIGILLALLHRQRTGKGQIIDIALFDTAISWMLQPIGSYLATGKVPERSGTIHPVAAPYQAFKTKDDVYITIGCAVDEHWRKLCEILGVKELAEDPRFATNPKRVENREELTKKLSRIFLTRSRAEWLKILSEAEIPCAPVNTVDKVVNDAQVLYRQMLVEIDHPTAGKIKVTGIPVKLSEVTTQKMTPPPLLGQHTKEILHELGYGDEDIRKLEEEGVI